MSAASRIRQGAKLTMRMVMSVRIMVVIVIMPVRMSVPMVVSVRVSVVMMASGEHADQVHKQPDEADNQQLVGVHFRRIDQALDGLKDDEDRDEDEEDSIGESRQRLDSTIPEDERHVSH